MDDNKNDNDNNDDNNVIQSEVSGGGAGTVKCLPSPVSFIIGHKL